MFKKLKYVLFKRAYQIFGRNSFSQAGEDMIIDFLLIGVGIKSPLYLELGVFHPRNGSNTYKFYVKGGRGVLVEADRSLIPAIIIERPLDKVLHLGVTFNDEKTATFYVFDEPSVSSFDKEEAKRRNAMGVHKLIREEQVVLKNLNQILDEDCSGLPHILSIDIEGLDYQVLKSWDEVLFPVPIVCAETCSYSNDHIKEKDQAILDLMETKGYFVYGDTYINTIFVHKAWFQSQKK